jgi:hypothetical protein
MAGNKFVRGLGAFLVLVALSCALYYSGSNQSVKAGIESILRPILAESDIREDYLYEYTLTCYESIRDSDSTMGIDLYQNKSLQSYQYIEYCLEGVKAHSFAGDRDRIQIIQSKVRESKSKLINERGVN